MKHSLEVKKLVSIGMSCQSANQLKLIAERLPGKFKYESSPFDWLICPITSLVCWLNDGLPRFKESEITEYREHAYWARYKTWFWHGFYRKENEVRTLDIKMTMERELKKFNYQKEKFLKTKVSQTIFIFSNCQNNLELDVFKSGEEKDFFIDENEIDQLQKSMDNYLGENCEIIYFTYKDRSSEQAQKRKNVIVLDKDESEWKGSDDQWGQFFSSYE